MARAAWQLSRTNERVTDIAFGAGYDTHEAFTRAFKTCFSTSPSGFRELEYRRTGLPATCGIHYDPDGGVPAFIPRSAGGQHMQVEITEMPELRVASIHHVGPYNQVSKAFERLGSLAGPAGLFAQPGAAMIGIDYDDPETTPHDQLRADAGVVVPASAALAAGLTEQRLPPGRYAKVVHTEATSSSATRGRGCSASGCPPAVIAADRRQASSCIATRPWTRRRSSWSPRSTHHSPSPRSRYT